MNFSASNGVAPNLYSQTNQDNKSSTNTNTSTDSSMKNSPVLSPKVSK